MPDSPGADGPQWESAALALRGLASFFPPFVPLPEAASAQTTKAACLTASGGAGVTADSGALGDSSTPCVLECPEHLEHPGSGKDQKSWLPAGVSGKHASRQGVGAMPRTGSERVCVPSHHLAEDLRPGGVRKSQVTGQVSALPILASGAPNTWRFPSILDLCCPFSVGSFFMSGGIRKT